MFADARHTDLPAAHDMARVLSERLPAFQDISWTPSTGSTNADLLARARAGGSLGKPWLLGAHVQESGRGRAGRAWENRVGAALMFSCAFDVHLPISELPALSPLAGLVACEALHQLSAYSDGLCLKWPNDVQWNDAKLAGVLVETVRNPGRRDNGYTAVIGIGLNLRDSDVLSQALGRQIADWTCVTEHTGMVPRQAADLVCAIANAWHEAVRELQLHGFRAFIERFNRLDALADRQINVLDQGTVLFSGTACGVDTHGRLLLQTREGTMPISVGEISIRPKA